MNLHFRYYLECKVRARENESLTNTDFLPSIASLF
jgi:hypothetical protein